MDFSTYTPIYVRAGGSDSGNGSTIPLAVATAQHAFNLALTGAGNFVLDFDAHTYAFVTLAADWPARIAMRGAGATISALGGISGQGAAGIGDDPAQNGFNITIVSDGTINLGDINVSGGDGEGFGGTGGNIRISDSIVGDVSSQGGMGFGWAGSGGDVTLSNSTSGAITTSGGDHSGDHGGAVTLSHSTSGAITTDGGGGGQGSYGGDVVLTLSTAGNISAQGGYGSGGPNAADGGAVVLTHSTSGDIITDGGEGFWMSIPNHGGDVTLSTSTAGDISAAGGLATLGHGGNVTLSYSESGAIMADGAKYNAPGDMSYMGLPQSGYGGTISLLHSTAADISSKGGYNTATDNAHQGYGGDGGSVSFINCNRSRINNTVITTGGLGSSPTSSDGFVNTTYLPSDVLGAGLL